MAENDQHNDEYKFSELDSYENESIENPDFNSDQQTTPSTGSGGREPKANVKRNVLILVGVVIFLMLMYKFIGGMLSGKPSSPPKENLPPVPAPIAETTPALKPQQTEIPPEPVPVQPVQTPAVQENNSELQQKVTSIESTQQSVQSEVNSMSQQVGNVNNNVNTLNAQITKLNQMIGDLTIQVSKQSEEINVLMQRTKPKPIKRVVRIQLPVEPIIYYINAVIPGRAWLIGSNGSTITVREGTNIAGYGVVKLIDSMQGRILTSSGRVIRFSKEDS